MRYWKDALTLLNNELHLRLYVIPGSSKSVFPAGYNNWRNTFEIRVESKAKDNNANIEVIDQIALYLKISSKDVCIISGQKSREKIVAIKNFNIEDLYRKIRRSLSEL